ncbi:MAG: hypothetical protein GC159_18800 [Phycisphaera sp.]|nr:hypothetical protein [Phycisphaera sp.]
MTRIITATLIALASLTLVACGDSGSAPAKSSGNGSAPTTENQVALAPTPEEAAASINENNYQDELKKIETELDAETK